MNEFHLILSNPHFSRRLKSPKLRLELIREEELLPEYAFLYPNYKIKNNFLQSVSDMCHLRVINSNKFQSILARVQAHITQEDKYQYNFHLGNLDATAICSQPWDYMERLVPPSKTLIELKSPTESTLKLCRATFPFEASTDSRVSIVTCPQGKFYMTDTLTPCTTMAALAFKSFLQAVPQIKNIENQTPQSFSSVALRQLMVKVIEMYKSCSSSMTERHVLADATTFPVGFDDKNIEKWPFAAYSALHDLIYCIISATFMMVFVETEIEAEIKRLEKYRKRRQDRYHQGLIDELSRQRKFTGIIYGKKLEDIDFKDVMQNIGLFHNGNGINSNLARMITIGDQTLASMTGEAILAKLKSVFVALQPSSFRPQDLHSMTLQNKKPTAEIYSVYYLPSILMHTVTTLCIKQFMLKGNGKESSGLEYEASNTSFTTTTLNSLKVSIENNYIEVSTHDGIVCSRFDFDDGEGKVCSGNEVYYSSPTKNYWLFRRFFRSEQNVYLYEVRINEIENQSSNKVDRFSIPSSLIPIKIACKQICCIPCKNEIFVTAYGHPYSAFLKYTNYNSQNETLLAITPNWKNSTIANLEFKLLSSYFTPPNIDPDFKGSHYYAVNSKGLPRGYIYKLNYLTCKLKLCVNSTHCLVLFDMHYYTDTCTPVFLLFNHRRVQQADIRGLLLRGVQQNELHFRLCSSTTRNSQLYALVVKERGLEFSIVLAARGKFTTVFGCGERWMRLLKVKLQSRDSSLTFCLRDSARWPTMNTIQYENDGSGKCLFRMYRLNVYF